jgi:hypothetical protein
MLMSPILHPPLCTYHQIQRVWTARTVHSDAEPGVLSGSGADGVPSAPRLEKENGGATSNLQGSPYRQVRGKHKEGCRASYEENEGIYTFLEKKEK